MPIKGTNRGISTWEHTQPLSAELLLNTRLLLTIDAIVCDNNRLLGSRGMPYYSICPRTPPDRV